MTGYEPRIQRLLPTSTTTIFHSPVTLIADTTIQDTIPSFNSCTEVDTLVFPIRYQTGYTVNITIVLHHTPMAIADVHKDSDLLVYPNPARDMLHVSGLGSGSHRVEVVALDGRVLMVRSGKGPQQVLPVDELARGCFLLRIRNDTGQLHLLRFMRE